MTLIPWLRSGHSCVDRAHALRMRIGKALQQQGIHHRKDGGICADGKRKGQDDRCREAGILAELTQSEFEILCKHRHEFSHLRHNFFNATAHRLPLWTPPKPANSKGSGSAPGRSCPVPNIACALADSTRQQENVSFPAQTKDEYSR